MTAITRGLHIFSVVLHALWWLVRQLFMDGCSLMFSEVSLGESTKSLTKQHRITKKQEEVEVSEFQTGGWLKFVKRGDILLLFHSDHGWKSANKSHDSNFRRASARLSAQGDSGMRVFGLIALIKLNV